MRRNNSEFIKECKSIFLKELEENFHWRIFRLSTFKDLIFSQIVKYNYTNLSLDKIELINICCKGLIIKELGEMDISNTSPEKIKNDIINERDDIISQYESIIHNTENNNLNFPFLLNDEKSYLKIVSQVNPAIFPEQNIRHILANLLKQ